MPKKEVSKTEKKEKKEKKHFFKDFKAELKRVIWPTPKQLVNNTVAVIVIVLITAAIVFVLDLVFEIANNFGVNKVRDFVEAYNEQKESTDTNQEAENAVDNILNEETTSDENTTDNDTVEDNSQAENNTVNE